VLRLVEDPELAAAAGANALELARTSLTWERAADGFERVYGEVAGARRPAAARAAT
jgi:glycosyltransferase involved in cell wall biosynthesis